MAEKLYRVLLADPPWKFNDSLPGNGRGASKKYPCMETWKIQRFPLPPLDPDALLFMWRCSAMVEEAYQVVRAWGFVPKAEIVWRKLTRTGKVNFGMGRYVRNSHETCIIARRGRGHVDMRSQRSVFDAPVGVEHSEKPDEFYRIIEGMAGGPYYELFARRPWPGWTQEGNQLGVKHAVAP